MLVYRTDTLSCDSEDTLLDLFSCQNGWREYLKLSMITKINTLGISNSPSFLSCFSSHSIWMSAKQVTKSISYDSDDHL